MGVMDDRSSRMFVGVCLLVLLWIGTYWLYEPGSPAHEAEVSFDTPALTLADPIVERDDPVTLPVSPTLPASDPVIDPPQNQPTVRVEPPDFVEYTIRDGDTLQSIARQRFGDEVYWLAISRSNPLRDPARLKAGDVIRIPVDPGNVQGVLVSTADGTPVEDLPQLEPDPWVEYTVQSGDSLTRIAQSYYGSVRHARAIYEANRDRMSSPDSLRIGQVILLPPLDTGD